MKKKEFKQFMKDIEACEPARRKFSRSKATPSEFWKTIHPAWMIYLLEELANGPFRKWDYNPTPEWEDYIRGELDLADMSLCDLLRVEEWTKKEAERTRKRILKLYPWKKIKKQVMEHYRWYRDNKTE